MLPVLVPEKVLPDKPTTRRERMGIELADIHEMVGIAGVPPHAETPVSNSAKKVIELLSELAPRKEYVRVEDFCGQHLEKLHQFVSESFQEVLALKFQSH